MWGDLTNDNPVCGTCRKKNAPFDGDINYIKKMKDLVTGFPFIMGCLFITLGTLGNAILLPWWMGILELAVSAIYIVALWLMVYEAAFSPRRKIDRTLLALRLFKIAAVLALIMVVLSFIVVMASMVPYLSYGGLLAGMVAAYVFVLLLIVLAALGLGTYAAVMLYIRPLFKVLDGIKWRIKLCEYAPLDGLTLFTVFTFLGMIYGVVITITNNQAAEGLLFVIFNCIGLILCLYTLRKFR